jgi:hypothetical protein
VLFSIPCYSHLGLSLRCHFLPFSSRIGWMTVCVMPFLAIPISDRVDDCPCDAIPCHSHLGQGGWLSMRCHSLPFPSWTGWRTVHAMPFCAIPILDRVDDCPCNAIPCNSHLGQGGWLPCHATSDYHLESSCQAFSIKCFRFSTPSTTMNVSNLILRVIFYFLFSSFVLLSSYGLGSELHPLRRRWTPNDWVSGLNSDLLGWEGVPSWKGPYGSLPNLYQSINWSIAISHLLFWLCASRGCCYLLLDILIFLISRCWSNWRAAKEMSWRLVAIFLGQAMWNRSLSDIIIINILRLQRWKFSLLSPSVCWQYYAVEIQVCTELELGEFMVIRTWKRRSGDLERATL